MLQMFQGLKIGMAIRNRLKSDSDRKELVTTCVSILGDGKCTKKEWTDLGNKLGVFDAG